jgi:hypothetical protein
LADTDKPKAVRNLEEALILLEGWLASFGLDLDTEGTFEERTERVLAILIETVPKDALILRPGKGPIERLYC